MAMPRIPLRGSASHVTIEYCTEVILESDAFVDGGSIPVRLTCDGEDVPPMLSWRDAPAGTATFALVMDDPDAPVGTWVHWVLFDVPASASAIGEGRLPRGTREGQNSWGRSGYGGPCPPSGTHRYFFKLYAVDRVLGLASGATASDLAQALEGHVLAEAVLMGRYARRPRS
jgi:Raf kinase inhibitor-like YbhB/YbcL family protein